MAGMNRWVAGARVRTLPAAVVPVVVGTAVASAQGTVIWWRAVAALVVALAIQIGTNYANDYSDGRRGTDDPSRRVGPVRLVGWGPGAPDAVRRAARTAFAVAGVAGLALAVAVDLKLLIVGALSFAAGWLYTGGPKPYGYAGFGELFVFLFFGIVATVGSTYVQTARITSLSVGAAVPIGFLATALLVVNNLRDIPGDTQSGKRTLAVRLGDQRTRVLYVALLIGAVVAVPLVGGLGARPAAALAFIAIPLAQRPVTHVLGGAKGPALIPVLAATAKVQLVFGTFFALGLAISG